MKENNEEDLKGQPRKSSGEIPIEFEDISSHSSGFAEDKAEAAKPAARRRDEKSEPVSYQRGRKPLEERDIIYPNKFIEFLAKNNKRNTKIILIVLLVIIIATIVIGIVFIKGKLDLITIDPGNDTYTGTEDENFDDDEFQAVHDVSDANSLDDLLYKWYNLDSELMSQKYILNVLLLGVDSETGQMTAGRSDVMMIVSLNKKTKKITLVSVMRDSRTFMNASGERTTKLNSAYFYGGPAATIECLESNLKIDIDYYVAVDFLTFPKLIDALGGVTVDMKEYEQKYINRTTSSIKKIPNFGEVTLDGKQALVYSRIRHCDADSDVSRTRRQRQVITAIIKSATGASAGQLNNALNLVLPYVRTDMSKSKILSYATQALSQGWMNYDIEQYAMPSEKARVGAMINKTSFWVVDWPLVAQETQMALYGTTNIELDANRVTALDYIKYNNQSSDGSSGSEGETTASESAQTMPDNNEAEEPTTKRPSIFDIFDRTTAAPADEQTQAPEEPIETQPPADSSALEEEDAA